ncbi:MAG: hypothetical protein HUK40_05320 [Desulfobacter sp.]|nr:hypothetical protein [Desulfobacter sp.]WDP87471.1 MAG: hypothetical protein HUN05_21990 [Desulfobacter sp.]
MADKPGRIRVIDQTLREGMQFHGLVFSLEQRIKMLEFQEMLGVDVCQAGYPSALDQEAAIVSALADHSRKKGFKIRIAALGRTLASDADILVKTRVDDPHFHFQIKKDMPEPVFLKALDQVQALFAHVKEKLPLSQISLAMLDMGKTDPQQLATSVKCLDLFPHLSILSLADTSGIMAPNQVFDRIRALAPKAGHLKLGVHCHNDMGMASANSLTGILAGAQILEASVLGIGERNGIADLYTTAKLLDAQGIRTGLDLDNPKGFTAYYTYVNQIVGEQTGLNLMDYPCPVFGAAVKTHVAGTHAQGDFGTRDSEYFFLNPLCGKGLIKQFLDKNKIPYPGDTLESITLAVKQASMDKGRALLKEEVYDLVRKTICKTNPDLI